jgi:hypothetical protein
MSAQQATNTETVVYVRLLDEGTDVWRAVPATLLPDGTYELSAPEGYDPQSEIWEFPPHARVCCVAKRFANGQQGLIALTRAG